MDLRRTFNTDEYNYDKAINNVGRVINIYDTIDLYLGRNSL